LTAKKGISGKKWLNSHTKQARKDFKNHKLLTEVGPGHWRISQVDTNMYWCDVVVMGGVGLAVWGDIDGCFFSYYSGAESPEELVYWIGDADIGYYGRQKARIGTGGLMDEYIDEVAIYDLYQRLKCAKDEFGDEWEEVGEKYTSAIEDAVKNIRNGYPVSDAKKGLYDDISELDQDVWEWLGSVGKVPSIRLIYAMTAVRRLAQLLRQKAKVTGKSST
jgi:hypothetical protein